MVSSRDDGKSSYELDFAGDAGAADQAGSASKQEEPSSKKPDGAASGDTAPAPKELSAGDILSDAEKIEQARKEQRNEEEKDGSPPQADPIFIKSLYAAFGLSFVKAINLTGYYPPEHPSIQNVATKPFEDLKALAPHASEVSFLTMQTGQNEEVMVDVLDEPLPFLKLLNSMMAETFALKFVNYLVRNSLVSFTIKTSITLDEFKRFLALIVERKTVEEEGGKAAAFGPLLLERKIYSVSVISRDEMLGANRFIPWRVKIAISRLQKDLGILPFYSEASELELQKAKQMLISDIIRPIRQPRFIRELLTNCDLIKSNVEELSEMDVEQEIIYCLQSNLLEEVTWDVVSIMERASWRAVTQKDMDGERRIDHILRAILKKLALRLVSFASIKTFEVLEKLFKKQVLTFEELPEKLQRIVLTEVRTKQYLETKNEILEYFNAATNPTEYGQFLLNFELVLPELIRRKKIDDALQLVRVLVEHCKKVRFAEQAVMIRYAIVGAATEENMELLVPVAGHEAKDIRTEGIEILTYFGDAGADALFKVMVQSEKSAVRRDVLNAIERMGMAAAKVVSERLLAPGFEWYVYRNLILLVERMKIDTQIEDVARYCRHQHPRVREQAVMCLLTLLGGDAENHIVHLLEDADWKVQRRVIAGLGDHHCERAAFRQHLLDVLKATKEGELAPEPIILAALSAITTYGNDFKTEDGREASAAILAMIVHKPSKLLERLFTKETTSFGPKIKMEALKTLSAIADRDVVFKMKQALPNFPPELQGHAKAAVRDIEHRIASGKS